MDERVQASVEKLGIRVHRRCYFHGWSQKETRVEFLRLMTPTHAIHLPCFALFYYGIKAIDLNAFKGIATLLFTFTSSFIRFTYYYFYVLLFLLLLLWH